MLLGLAYLNGEGIARDKPLGLEWINKSSKNGHEPAKKILDDLKLSREKKHNALVSKYQQDISSWPRSDVKQLEQSANKGNSLSQEHLAIAYQFGLLQLSKSPQIAADWYLKSIADNTEELNFSLQRNLNLIYIEGIYQAQQENNNEYLKAKLKIDALAEQGDLAAIKFLARLYINEENGFSSLKLSKFWYEKAAYAGDHGAQLALARLYTYNAPNEAGIDAKPDYEKALHWYKKVVVYDMPHAQYELAKLYISSEGRTKNNKEAIELLKKAADKNIIDAQLDLAKAYKEGVITGQNYPMALQQFQKLAAITYAQNSFLKDYFYISAMSIAELHEKGLGSPVDKIQAYAWYDSILEHLQKKLLQEITPQPDLLGGEFPQQINNAEKDSQYGYSLLGVLSDNYLVWSSDN